MSTQRTRRVNPRNGSARIVAERSGWAMAQDLGAISPTTMCRNTTTTRLIANAIDVASAAGSPIETNSGSSRCAIGGLGDRAEARACTR